jgi:hypothetical protein
MSAQSRPTTARKFLLTIAQERAKTLLSIGPLHRSRDGWMSDEGYFVALIVGKKLRDAGIAKLSPDRRWLLPS